MISRCHRHITAILPQKRQNGPAGGPTSVLEVVVTVTPQRLSPIGDERTCVAIAAGSGPQGQRHGQDTHQQPRLASADRAQKRGRPYDQPEWGWQWARRTSFRSPGMRQPHAEDGRGGLQQAVRGQ